MAAAASTTRRSGKAMPVQLNLDHVAPATRLLEKRRQMVEVQDALDAQKEEYAKREEAFKRREEQLRKKDLELQESLIRFNKFLKENETKRVRAQKKTEEESKARADKEKQIDAERKALQQAKLQKAQLEEQLSKNKVYFDYLQRVKDENETEFPEIEYIMDRFSVLSGELSGLQEKQMTLSAESEQLRATFQQYTKEQMNLNLGLNNDIARLQKQLEEAEAVTAQLQSGLDADMKNVSDRTTAVSRVVMSVENLERRCRQAVTYLKHYESMNKPEELGSSTSIGGDDMLSATTAGQLMNVSKQEREARAELEHRRQLTLDRLVIVGAYLRDFADMVQEYDVHRKEELKSGKAAAAAAAVGATAKLKAKPMLGQTAVSNSTIGANGLTAAMLKASHNMTSAQNTARDHFNSEESHGGSRNF